MRSGANQNLGREDGGDRREELTPYIVDELSAASYIGISRPSLRVLVAEGRIRRLKLPGLRRNLYRVRDLEAFADSLVCDDEGAK